MTAALMSAINSPFTSCFVENAEDPLKLPVVAERKEDAATSTSHHARAPFFALCHAVDMVNRQELLAKHMLTHEIGFPRQDNRPRRSDSNAETRRFECETCHVRFRYKHVLQNHVRIHTGEKPFVCQEPGCDKRFTRDHHLKTHMRLHTGEKPFKCYQCGKKFVQVANLRRHERVHYREQMNAFQSYLAGCSKLNPYLFSPNPFMLQQASVVAPIHKPVKEEPMEEIEDEVLEDSKKEVPEKFKEEVLDLKEEVLENLKEEVMEELEGEAVEEVEEFQEEPEDLSLKRRNR